MNFRRTAPPPQRIVAATSLHPVYSTPSNPMPRVSGAIRDLERMAGSLRIARDLDAQVASRAGDETARADAVAALQALAVVEATITAQIGVLRQVLGQDSVDDLISLVQPESRTAASR